MKYRELFQFDPLASSVRLLDAEAEHSARDLVSTYQITTELAARISYGVLPRLQFDRPSDAGALLLVGPTGAGKSHLLAVLSALAERGELAATVTNREALALTEDSQAAGAAGLESVAGRFRVIRAVLEPGARSLGDGLRASLEQHLADAEIAFRFPAAPSPWWDQAVLAAMMAAWQEKFPEHGLLLVVDDLLDYLRSRRARDLSRDLACLNQLGAACRTLRIRLIATARESMFGLFPAGKADGDLRCLSSHWAEVGLGIGVLQHIAAARMVRKTPEQRTLIEAHLEQFSNRYGPLKERMAEFVDSFPLHPDCVAAVAKVDAAARHGVLRLLAAVVAKRLDDTLDDADPGIIAYDSCWPALCSRVAFRHGSEVRAVIDFTRQLEARVDRAVSQAENRGLARRLINALAMQRLAACDLYGGCGDTAADLRDTLCLHRPGLDAAAPDPAGDLLAEVSTTLEELGRNAPRSVVAVRANAGRHHLHFQKFRRFNNPELILHWANAIPFLILMATGAIMLGSRFFQLDRELFTWTVLLHKGSALTWFCALPLSVLSRLRPHLANIRTLLTWNAEDAAWMIQSVRSLYQKSAVIPPADRFNTGQKINSCLVIVYYFGFVATGVLMFAKGTILFPWYIHTALYFSAMGSVGGHLFLAFINPSTRIALGGIFHGWAPMKYVEHHHALSLPPSLRAHAHPVGVRSSGEHHFVSKVEIAALLGTLLLGGAGLYAFGLGRLAAAKQQFAQSFADVIQPSQLTTQHRFGPAAESCTKCHLFTGEIPDRKCEECHKDVRDRRAERLGYHGTLEGDCRTCHREHREHAQTLVPLIQAEFDHRKAIFQLEGKHAQVKCDECHRETRRPDTPGIYYLGLRYGKCADCHADQHSGQFVASCETCHSPAGWTGENLKFRHEAGSDFQLAGQHATVDCRKCHRPAIPGAVLGTAKFKGLARDCAGCHEDPHRQQFANRCTDCHTPAGWGAKNLNFAHNKDSHFPLVAKHETVACAKCHRPLKAGDPLGRAQFRGLKTECADCHQEPHRGQFARDCTQCHPAPETWQVGAPLFVHDRDTKFRLLGGHAAVECIKCHRPLEPAVTLASAKFTGLETSCQQCHVVDHPQWYGSTCTACHTPAKWIRKQPAFDHGRDAGFELAGRHMLTQCRDCHTDAVFGVLEQKRRPELTCLSCHEKAEPHQGTLGRDCQKCHGPVGWKGEDLLFDHNSMASFALNADHRNVACANCHKQNVWKPLDAACVSCHRRFIGQ